MYRFRTLLKVFAIGVMLIFPISRSFAGGEPYYYYVKYQQDINKALQELRQREFHAGRYFPAMFDIQFPVDENSPAPGAKHDSIDMALEAAEADGTRSILDIERISESKENMAAANLSEDVLKTTFGTAQPTHETVETNLDPIFEMIDRGQAVYVVVYKDGSPDEIMFAGYSFD